MVEARSESVIGLLGLGRGAHIYEHQWAYENKVRPFYYRGAPASGAATHSRHQAQNIAESHIKSSLGLRMSKSGTTGRRATRAFVDLSGLESKKMFVFYFPNDSSVFSQNPWSSHTDANTPTVPITLLLPPPLLLNLYCSHLEHPVHVHSCNPTEMETREGRKAEAREQRAQYDANGYVRLGPLTDHQLQRLCTVLDQLSNTLEPDATVFEEGTSGKIKQIQYLHQRDPVFANLLQELRPVAERLTRQSELNVLNMQLFEKHPLISKPTRTHQDNAYFQLQPANAVTFWIALDTMDEENGCLYYTPGTHKAPTLRHERFSRSTTFRTRSGVPGMSICLKGYPTEKELAMCVPAGTVLAHHCNLVHRAGANRSKARRRRAIGLVFVPSACGTDARLLEDHQQRLRVDKELVLARSRAAAVRSEDDP